MAHTKKVWKLIEGTSYGSAENSIANTTLQLPDDHRRIPWKESKVVICEGVTLPLRPQRYINFLEPFHFFMASDQLVVPIGATHISYHNKNTIEETGEKKKKNEQYAWG